MIRMEMGMIDPSAETKAIVDRVFYFVHRHQILPQACGSYVLGNGSFPVQPARDKYCRWHECHNLIQKNVAHRR